MKPVTQMFVVLLVAAGLNLGTIAALHDSRTENQGLHVDLVDSTLKRRALEQAREDEWARVRADRLIVKACKTKLALRDAQYESDIIRRVIRTAEYYHRPAHEVVEAAQ